MIKTLKEISQIRFGYFSKTTANAGIPYLHARQFDEYGNMVAPPDTYLKQDNKVTERLLNDGDILLAGKGYKNFAWCYHTSFGKAIASTTFYIITPDRGLINPDYLTVLFNHPKNQLYFQHLGAGNNIPSIRKNEVGEFKVPIVPLELQAKIVALYEAHKKDINLTLQLLQKKNELYDTVINKLVNN